MAHAQLLKFNITQKNHRKNKCYNRPFNLDSSIHLPSPLYRYEKFPKPRTSTARASRVRALSRRIESSSIIEVHRRGAVDAPMNHNRNDCCCCCSSREQLIAPRHRSALHTSLLSRRVANCTHAGNSRSSSRLDACVCVFERGARARARLFHRKCASVVLCTCERVYIGGGWSRCAVCWGAAYARLGC